MKFGNLKPIIVSNRLPIRVDLEEGHYRVNPGTGGLVTALAPILRDRGGNWIGWPGAPINEELADLLKEESSKFGFKLNMVDLTEDEISGYYRGFSNEIIWPLFHDLLDHCNFKTEYWEFYQASNYKFARAVMDITGGGNFIWLQDYQLLMAGHFLKEMEMTDTAFFLHIPFPPKDIFIKLPWRSEIIKGLLSYRLVGFQTERDRRNFIQCLRHLLPEAKISHHRKFPYIRYNNHITRIGAFPISIDFKQMFEFARSKEVADAAWLFHEKFPQQKIMLGVDRLDYTKGIPHRLEAFERCLRIFPEMRQKITLVQLVIPSRTEVPEYQALKKQIDETVGRINGEFTEHGWVPIHYIYGTLSKTGLFGVYRAADIALITPLKDGMNLVAKEYCVSCIDDRGVMILSEFAGAASELNVGAILVNPYNVEEVAQAIHRAHFMGNDEQQDRIHRMRAAIRNHDIFRWVDQFVTSFDFEENPDSRFRRDRSKEPAGPTRS